MVVGQVQDLLHLVVDLFPLVVPLRYCMRLRICPFLWTEWRR